MLKKGVILIIGLLIVFFSISVVAESTTIKVITYTDPVKIIKTISSQPYGLYFFAGKYFFNKGNLDRAEEMFSKAAEYNPEFSPAYHNLGVIYYTNGDMDSATKEFERAIEVDPEYAKGYYSLGIINFELGEYDLAIKYFLESVQLEPDNANMNFDLAQSYVARFRKNEPDGTADFNDLENALIYLGKAQEIEPDFPYVINNIEIIESIVKARQELLS